MPIVLSPSTPSDSAKYNKKSFCEKYKHELEFLAVASAVIYAFLTYFEWKTFDSERKTMEKENILEQRAWVAPFEIATETDPIETNISVIVLKFKNTGKTPALNVSEVHCTCLYGQNIPTNDPPVPKSSFLMAPDGIFWIHSDSFDSKFINAVKNGIAVPIFMYGKITYDDIFGNPHWTQFCWGLEGGGHFRPAGVHNSCDDNQ